VYHCGWHRLETPRRKQMAQYITVRALNRNANIRLAAQSVWQVSPKASSGNFTITVGGQTTGNLAFNASTSTIQTALEALSNVDPGDVVVTGGPGALNEATPYVLTFGGQYNDIAAPKVSGTDVSLAGSGHTVNVTQLSGPGVKLSTTVDTLVDLDNVVNRRALARHSAIGQFIVTSANNNDGGTALPANS